LSVEQPWDHPREGNCGHQNADEDRFFIHGGMALWHCRDVKAGTAAPPAPPPPGGDLLSSVSVRAVQTRLRALGFYSGATDGVWGPSTQAAIEHFQQGRGLQPNGQLNPATLAAIGLTPDELTYR
jgi:hypothetical protein